MGGTGGGIRGREPLERGPGRFRSSPRQGDVEGGQDVSEVRAALVRAMRWTAVTLALFCVGFGAVAWAVAGPDAAMAGLAGVGVAAFVGLSTQAAMFLGSRLSSTSLSVIVLGSFLLKVVILVLVALAIRGSDLSTGAFVASLAVAVVATLVIDVLVLARARVPYVTSDRPAEPG